jgi:hypothetical protein
MTKILLWAALAYAIVAMAAILIDDGVTDARLRPTTTIVVDVPADLVEDAVELRTARTDGPSIGRSHRTTRRHPSAELP